jgi:pantoate--beta-alanine ligase
MISFKKSNQIAEWLETQRSNGLKTGFCPTMGALHPGHLSLIDACKKENDICISSIFVNPAQFNDPKDFEKYPSTLEHDIDMLEEAGCDTLFIPSVKEIYPGGVIKTEHYDLGFLETILEGKYRPGHYQGVCMVMERLLKIALPDNLYLGQKDYQQCMVIKRLIELTGLSGRIKTNICPTIREPDGLAMSSRNMRLNKTERETATEISKTLFYIREKIKPGPIIDLKQTAFKMLESKGFKVDYMEIADAVNLEMVNDWNGKQKIVALAAAYLNEIRLIDNVILN